MSGFQCKIAQIVCYSDLNEYMKAQIAIFSLFTYWLTVTSLLIVFGSVPCKPSISLIRRYLVIFLHKTSTSAFIFSFNYEMYHFLYRVSRDTSWHIKWHYLLAFGFFVKSNIMMNKIIHVIMLFKKKQWKQKYFLIKKNCGSNKIMYVFF